MSDDSTSMILAALRTLQAGQDELRAGQDGLRADMTTLRVDLMARLDRHEDALTRIREDIGVNMGRVDRVQDSSDATREELRLLGKVVSGMGRQIHDLQTRMDRLDLRGGPRPQA